MTAGTFDGSSAAAVAASGLRKRYRLGEHRSLALTMSMLLRRDARREEFEALAGIDFACARGESLGIVGVNGSGKSTLLQILAGTTLPTSGEMRVRGHVMPLLSVGSGFHPELTGRENVRLFAASLRIPRGVIEERMGAVTSFAELERHMDTPLKRFSTGMTSRLSFAIGMQFPADVYVFDEVLAVVDGEFRARCVEEIKRLHGEGRTVIFVSHNLGQVADVCQRVMWLERGVVRDIGPAAQVLEGYEAVHRPGSDGASDSAS